MTSPGYVALLAAHVLCAIAGLGALGATGYFAHLARRVPDPFALEQLRRYFRPGPNLAAAGIYGIPVLGGAMLALSSADAHQAYPWIGLGCWVAIAGLATGAIWPAERRLRVLLATAGDVAEVRSVATRAERAAAVASAVGFVAVVVMFAQP